MSEITRALARFWVRTRRQRGCNPTKAEDDAFIKGWRAAVQVKLSLVRKARRSTTK